MFEPEMLGEETSTENYVFPRTPEEFEQMLKDWGLENMTDR